MGNAVEKFAAARLDARGRCLDLGLGFGSVWRRGGAGLAAGGAGWRGAWARSAAHGGRLFVGHLVALGDELNVEDELGLGGDDGRAAGFAVGELVGDEETALATDVHAFEAGVPAFDDAVLAVGEGDGLAAVDGGVKLGAVGEIAGVVDGVVLAGLGEGAGADYGVDVDEGVGGLLLGELGAKLGADEGGDVVEMDVRDVGEGVEGARAGCVGGEGGDLGGEFGDMDAPAAGQVEAWCSAV